MDEALKADCADLFRKVSGLSNSTTLSRWNDERLLVESLDTLDVDSLTLLEFVMEIENAYNVELDEADVNLCQNLRDFVDLIASARNGSN